MANNNPRTLNINHQAINILEDYFTKVSQDPAHVEREDLLEKIKAVPDCGDYDMAHMTAWFSEQKERALQHSDDDNDSRFPSLTPSAIQHLTILANSQPNPPPELLKTWAALLASSGAKEQDVINWTHHRNQEQQLQHLPTPSDTTSMTPDPPSTSQSPAAQSASPQETITSPVVPALQSPFYERGRATPPESSPTPPSPSNNDPRPNLQYPRDPVLQAIIHGVRDALANSETTPTTAAPKSAAEFEAMFSPYEQRMSLLLHALEST